MIKQEKKITQQNKDKKGVKPYIVKIFSHGGITMVNDYLMSDGTIKTMSVEEAEEYKNG